MDERVCVVTGANSGIGKASAKAIAGLGAKVVMVCRDRGRGEAAMAEVVDALPDASLDLLIADLRSLGEVRRLAAEFGDRHARLDALVNNAGTRFAELEPTAEGYESTFALNHLAPFLLTHLLLDVLRASAPSRVVMVGSNTHRRATIDFDDLMGERGYDEARAYDQSKLANVLFTYELARRMRGTGVTAFCVDPGAADTNIGLSGGPAFRERWRGRLGTLAPPERPAETVAYAALSEDLAGATGLYLADRAPVESSPGSHDEDVARRLWEVSEALTRPGSPAASGG